MVKTFGEDIIIINHLSKSFGNITALKDIHLSQDSEFFPIRSGEFVVLRGPSGGGKTTLLNIIGTLDSPTTGEIKLLGEKISGTTTDKFLANVRLKKMGFVFQAYNLLPHLSAFENVELPMLMANMGVKQRREKALKLLKMVGLQDRVSHLPSELSGGEQQRVTIARSLANDPLLLLLDEPTGDLDSRNTVEIMNLLLKINLENKTTCVMVTHNDDIECYADRLLYLRDGQFQKQVLNRIQVPLDYEEYTEYLRKKDTSKD